MTTLSELYSFFSPSFFFFFFLFESSIQFYYRKLRSATSFLKLGESWFLIEKHILNAFYIVAFDIWVRSSKGFLLKSGICILYKPYNSCDILQKVGKCNKFLHPNDQIQRTFSNLIRNFETVSSQIEKLHCYLQMQSINLIFL